MSFDRVASVYDATRGMPDEVSERIADRIVDVARATPETRFLELGIGTGRIALPLLRRGYRVTGIDISHEMTSILREKARAAGLEVELISADITRQPLPDDSVDVVQVVHVLHLVPEWRKVLDEVRRVLRPGGTFIMGGESHDNDSPAAEMRRQWQVFVHDTGTELRPPYGTWDAVETALTEMGQYLAVYRVALWREPFRPRDYLQEQLARTYSLTWTVPDDILHAVHDRLEAWARDRYGHLDQTLQATAEFRMLVTRFA